MKPTTYVAVLWLTAVITIAVVLAGYYDWKECEAREGTLVRGVFWFECVGGHR